MRITGVESMLLSVPYEDHGGTARNLTAAKVFQTLLVRVDTDEGLSGWGEVFTRNGEPALKAIFDTHVAPRLIGRDPTQIARIRRELEMPLHNFGRIGPLAFGISGVDIALWDILGQAAGLPLWRLLGGTDLAEVDCYASLTRYGTPDGAAAASALAVERGYRAVKLHEVDPATVPACRAAIGPGIALMMDTNCPWTLAEARRAMRDMAPANLAWLEEPVWPPENYQALAALRAEGITPIAAGENAGSLMDYRMMFEAGAVDIVQPDVGKALGITEMLKIAALAEAYNVELVPHCYMIGAGYVASIHLCAAFNHRPLLERYFIDLAIEPMGAAVAPRRGKAPVPQGPGLGAVPDPEAIRRFRVA